MTCAKNGIARLYDSLRDCWGDLLRQAVVQHVKKETAVGHDGPADILLMGFSKGLDAEVDLTVTCPCTLDQYPLTPDTARQHLPAAEAAKLHHNGASCKAMGWECLPMAYSTWGEEGPGAKKVFQEKLKWSTADI